MRLILAGGMHYSIPFRLRSCDSCLTFMITSYTVYGVAFEFTFIIYQHQETVTLFEVFWGIAPGGPADLEIEV